MTPQVTGKAASLDEERQFAQTVAEHKSTIYTVCYMFSQDADEVNDLFGNHGDGSTVIGGRFRDHYSTKD